MDWMNWKSVIGKMKHKCMEGGLDAGITYQKTEWILRLYRKINWSVGRNIEELSQLSYENFSGDLSAQVSYLLNFAPESEYKTISGRAANILHTKLLVDLIEKSAEQVKTYPKDGEIYYTILNMKYLSSSDYAESDILDALNMARSTYYRRKKEVIYLMGYILFGLVLPELIGVDKNREMRRERDFCGTNLRLNRY